MIFGNFRKLQSASKQFFQELFRGQTFDLWGGGRGGLLKKKKTFPASQVLVKKILQHKLMNEKNILNPISKGKMLQFKKKSCRCFVSKINSCKLWGMKKIPSQRSNGWPLNKIFENFRKIFGNLRNVRKFRKLWKRFKTVFEEFFRKPSEIGSVRKSLENLWT